MNWKLTAAQALQVAKRVAATYLTALLTGIVASNFDWHVGTIEKAGVAALTPALVLLQSIVSSWLTGTPQLAASVRLLTTGRSAPKAIGALGKQPAVQDRRTLRFIDYIVGNGLPKPPKTLTWAQKVVSLGMMLNDRLGDCTIAAMGHSIQLWTSNVGAQFTVPDALILSKYSQLSGYNPATGANDNGCVELEVLKDWRTNGLDGHKIGGFVALNTKDATELKQAIDLFGLVYIGTNVPAGWEQAPAVWSVLHGAAGKIVGGHAVILVGYDNDGFWLISWGQLFKITYSAVRKYVDEAYGLVSTDWLSTATGSAPSGFNLSQLTADLAAFSNAA